MWNMQRVKNNDKLFFALSELKYVRGIFSDPVRNYF